MTKKNDLPFPDDSLWFWFDDVTQEAEALSYEEFEEKRKDWQKRYDSWRNVEVAT